MPESELPSTRSILERETIGASSRNQPAKTGEDEDFRRVIARLRAVLEVRGS